MGRMHVQYKAESLDDLADGLQKIADDTKYQAETLPPTRRAQEYARARGIEEAADIVRSTTIVSP